MRKVLTVLGPVDPEELGQTLVHEHVFADLREHWTEPETASGRWLADQPVRPEMLARLRRFPFSTSRDNLLLGDEEMAIAELDLFRRAGGGTVVDVSSIGLARDPEALARVSRATGLHIVMGGGCYVEHAHPPWVADASLEELTDRFADDVLVGVDGTRVRSGVIGEVGVSGFAKGRSEKAGHMTSAEEKVLRAAARAAVRTGAAVSVHVDLRSKGAFEVLDKLEDEGLPAGRSILCHMDFVEDLDYHREIAARGAHVEYSSCGREYYEDRSGISWGNDRTRIEMLAELIEEGLTERLLISHDVCMKMDLRRYGGNGYGHISTALVERMRRRGISSQALTTILVDNPARVLAIDFGEAELAAIEADSQSTANR